LLPEPAAGVHHRLHLLLDLHLDVGFGDSVGDPCRLDRIGELKWISSTSVARTRLTFSRCSKARATSSRSGARAGRQIADRDGRRLLALSGTAARQSEASASSDFR
jgi:hypothetical protein